MMRLCSVVMVIYICIDRNHFHFTDVPGDGDCFFHSILKSNYLSRFSSVHELRMHLATRTELTYANDLILQQIFYFHRINVAVWLNSIRTMGTWANELDMLLTAYILHINIISVGNYINGLICNNMQLHLNQILQHNDCHITENSVIYVYFHRFQDPIARTSNGNHFAYMDPVFSMDNNNNNLQSDFSFQSPSHTTNIQCEGLPNLIKEDDGEHNIKSNRLQFPDLNINTNETLESNIDTSKHSLDLDDTKYIVPDLCTTISREDQTSVIPDLCGTIDRKETLRKCLDVIDRTSTQNRRHKARVCVVCDSFIIGTEKNCWLTEEQLQNKKSVLSVTYLESTAGKRLPLALRDQYKIKDNVMLSDLLLSPRAHHQDGSFMACETCYNNIAYTDSKTPPKYAITNSLSHNGNFQNS